MEPLQQRVKKKYGVNSVDEWKTKKKAMQNSLSEYQTKYEEKYDIDKKTNKARIEQETNKLYDYN